MKIKLAALVALPIAASLALAGCSSGDGSPGKFGQFGANGNLGSSKTERPYKGQALSDYMAGEGFRITPDRAQEFMERLCTMMDKGVTGEELVWLGQDYIPGGNAWDALPMIGSGSALLCFEHDDVLDTIDSEMLGPYPSD